MSGWPDISRALSVILRSWVDVRSASRRASPRRWIRSCAESAMSAAGPETKSTASTCWIDSTSVSVVASSVTLVVSRNARKAKLSPNQTKAAVETEKKTAVSSTGVISATQASGLVSASMTAITPIARTASRAIKNPGWTALGCCLRRSRIKARTLITRATTAAEATTPCTRKNEELCCSNPPRNSVPKITAAMVARVRTKALATARFRETSEALAPFGSRGIPNLNTPYDRHVPIEIEGVNGPGTRKSWLRWPTYVEIMTGAPNGRCSANNCMTSLVTRTQPLEIPCPSSSSG